MMTKQLITLIGVLISAAVLVIAVIVGVVPLVGGVFGAYGQTVMVAATNAGFEQQIDALEAEQERIEEIDAAVAELRAQIPAAENLNEVFERISRAEQDSGTQVVSVTRGDLEPFQVRSGVEDGSESPESNAAGTPSSDGATTPPEKPIDATDQAASDAAGPPDDQPAGAAADEVRRLQVELSITIRATDTAAAVAFIDGLRAGPRAIAIDKVAVTGIPGSLDVQITALAFIQKDVQAEGGE